MSCREPSQPPEACHAQRSRRWRLDQSMGVMFSRGTTAPDGAGAVVSPHREQYGCTGIGPSGFLHGDELLVLREPREDLLRDAEIGREKLTWAGRQPPGERDLFIDRAVEHEHRTAILVADILNVMPEPLRHVAYVAG